MRTLIIIRHGQPGSEPNPALSELGRVQMADLAEKIRPLTNNGTTLIVTSPLLRAQQSAAILGETLRLTVEEHTVLEEQMNNPPDYIDRAVELVAAKQNDVETLILVTHFGLAEAIPRLWCQTKLGFNPVTHSLCCGQAWVVDCYVKAVTRLLPSAPPSAQCTAEKAQ